MPKKKKEANQEQKREFIVGLRHLYDYPKPHRAKKGISLLKKFAFKHFRISADNVLISNAVNEFLWHRGRENVPRKILITIIVSKGKANIFLKGEKISMPKEEKKEKHEEKKTVEEKAMEEEKEKKQEEKKLAEKSAEKTAIKRGKE